MGNQTQRRLIWKTSFVDVSMTNITGTWVYHMLRVLYVPHPLIFPHPSTIGTDVNDLPDTFETIQ